jgi:hypothetical protein
VKILISDHDYKLHSGGTAKPRIERTLDCRWGGIKTNRLCVAGRPQSEAERRGKQSKHKLDGEPTEERRKAVRANRMRCEMLLANARGELIEKSLVEKQAAYLLIAFRQRAAFGCRKPTRGDYWALRMLTK